MGREEIFVTKDDWKKIEKNNVTVALNVLYVKKEKYILLMFQKFEL